MPFTPAMYTLGYVLSVDGQSVLLVRRFVSPDRVIIGLHNGLGGKVERDEDVASGMIREIREEAGIEVEAMELRGTVSWPGASQDNGARFGFVFLVTQWSGEPPTENEEGTLAWHRLEDVLAGRVTQWPGREAWLHLVFDGDLRPFHGVEPHQDGVLIPGGWRHSRW